MALLSFMVFPLLLSVLMTLDALCSKLTPSGVTGIRAGLIVTEKLLSKPNTIHDILHFKYSTIILLFDHFSALKIIFIIHFIPQ